MKPLRLVADDLTGALDSGAQFADSGRGIPVFLAGKVPTPPPESFAIDADTREGGAGRAVAIATRLARFLAGGGGAVSFKKVDSLLRGHPGLEIAATLTAVPVRHCVIAPAFPYHGRATRGGVQHAVSGGSWIRVGEDVATTLRAKGMAVQLRRPGDPVPVGVSLWDAETDDDLRRIAASGAGLGGMVLWCGSGGLAAALSGSPPPAVPAACLERPMLGIFGSDHPVTAAQLAACGDVLTMSEPGSAGARDAAARLEGRGVCLVSLEPSRGLARPEAARRIALAVAELARGVPRPRSVIAAGGETLRALCLSLGADYLEVMGQVVPGMPVSRVAGGRWDGVQVISKSGAFGDEGLLLRLIPGAGAG
jgi:uncharacterized protein YgbK (DUF1537 family)